MIYGLYLSAAGVIANSYRQDVISNNLANAETDGFKRNTTAFQQRLTEAQLQRNLSGESNSIQEGIGGGLLVSPTRTDYSQGELEATDNPLDVSVQGKGFLAVDGHGATRLTRAGNLTLDKDGTLILDNGQGEKVLDKDMKPITLDPTRPGQVAVDRAGLITQNGKALSTLSLVDVNDSTKLIKRGSNLLDPSQAGNLQPGKGQFVSGYLERANVDPATELTQLMDAQRQLEANANMIRYQDETLGKAVTDVGKLS